MVMASLNGDFSGDDHIVIISSISVSGVFSGVLSGGDEGSSERERNGINMIQS